VEASGARQKPGNLKRAAPPLCDPHVYENDERGASHNRRQEEVDGHHGRPPLWGEHVRYEQVEGAERALVQGRQRDSSDREHDRFSALVPCAEDPCEGAEDRGRHGGVEEVA